MFPPIARTILYSDLSDELLASVAGNAPRKVKEAPLKWLAIFRSRDNSFANAVAQRIRVAEVSVVKNPEDPRRKEGRVVCELEVTKDMISSSGNMDHGCAVFLIDECSIFSLAALNVAEGRNFQVGVSQAINTVFHNPAPLGTQLRVVNTTMSTGDGMGSCRSEIWDIGRHCLVASGVQLQMVPTKL